jgi:hypothetical protein
VRAVLVLAWARLRHRPASWLLVAFGVAGATLLPVLTRNSSTIVAAQALRHGIAALPAGQRSLTVSYNGLVLTPDDLATLDGQARDRLAGLSARPARRELLYRPLADAAGGTFSLGATDDLAGAVRVTSGRLPVSCQPQRCEVVIVGTGTPTLDPALGLVPVGRAVRTDPLLLGGTFDPGNDKPLLLVDGVAAGSRLAALEQSQRAYGWVAPLDLDRVRQLGVAGYLARSARAPDDPARWRPGLTLTAPDDVLRGEDARARRSAGRFALLGGAGTALLLGFAVIGAIGLRRDHAAVVDLLRRRGAGRAGVGLLTALQSGVPVAVGTVAGLAVAVALAGIRAAAAGLPGVAAARDAAAGSVVPVLVGVLGAAAVVAATLSARAAGSAATVRRVLDVTVLAGVAAAALALARGSVTAGSDDPVLLALPVIGVVCGGLAAGRVWPLLLTPVARLLPARWLGPRLGLLAALRRPLRPVATVAFLAAAVAVVVFAGGYRATLNQGAVDQAAFAVPLDARVTIGPTADRPLDVAGVPAFAATAPGVTVHPVLRASAGVRVSAAESQPAELVGVDPAALAKIRSWDADVGASGAADAARRIAGPAGPTGPAGPAGPTGPPPGIPVAPDARAISFDATGDTDRATVTAWLRTGDGRDIGLDLQARAGQLTAALPAGLPAPTRLFALALAEPFDYATRHQHHIGEGNTDVAVLSGTVTLGLPRLADGATWSGWNSAQAQVTASGTRLAIAFQFTGARVVLTPLPSSAPIPVLADPATAATAAGGLLQLTVSGNRPVTARVVRVVPRFPTAGARFVVADVHALAGALDAREPGTGSVSELWLWAPDGAAGQLATALAAPPFDRLTVDLRQSRQDQLSGDPVARGAASLLTVSALVAVLVAMLAVVLLVVAERRDESAELFAWESDGVPPRTLRVSLFSRAAAVVAGAVPAGLLVGLLLSRITAALVQVTAVGTAPVPPLRLAAGPAWVAGVLALGVAAGLLVAAAVAGTALRERMPRLPGEVGS